MLTKPRTVCACQLVTDMISASVAPLARFIIAMTSAFLLVASDFGLPAAFFARGGFFPAFAFFAGFFPALGCAKKPPPPQKAPPAPSPPHPQHNTNPHNTPL